MTKITAVIAASAVIASSSFAFAGGPVEVMAEPEPVVVMAAPSSGGSLGANGAAIAIAAGVIVVGAALASSDSGSH